MTTVISGVSRRKAIALGAAAVMAPALRPFDALAQGLPVEGLSTAFVDKARAAIQSAQSLKAMRAEIVSIRERMSTINPFGVEYRARQARDTGLWYPHSQVAHEFYHKLSAMRCRSDDPVEQEVQTEFLKLWPMYIEPLPKVQVDWEKWSGWHNQYYAKRRNRLGRADGPPPMLAKTTCTHDSGYATIPG